MSPHEIAQLAQTRRVDPDLALAIATEAGKSHDEYLKRLTLQSKDSKDASAGR